MKQTVIILNFIVLLTMVVLNSTCRQKQIIPGKSELVGIKDTLLNDSSIIEGSVYMVDFVTNYPFSVDPFEVWISNTNIKAKTDTTRRYQIKTIPGTYSVRCQRVGNKDDRFIEGINNLKVLKNQKAIVNFYLGYIAE